MARNFYRHSYFLVIFILIAAVYIVSRPMVTLDSYWAIPTSLSLINEGNFELDEYIGYGLRESYASILIENHYYNFFPYGISILISPIIFFLNFFISESIWFNHHAQLEKLSATIIVLISLLFLYRLFTFYLLKKKAAFLIFAIALGTPLLTSGSRALWQHPGSVLLLSIVLLILNSKKQTRFSLNLIGIILVFSYVVRPTNIIPLVFISYYLIRNYRANRMMYIITILIMLVLFFILNFFLFDDFIHPYYRSNRLSFDWELFRIAIFGNLLSPNRGILIWSPVLFVIFLTIFISGPDKPILLLCLTVVIMHLLAISMFPHWWGGHSVGPRFFTDIIPFFGLILAIVWKHFQDSQLFSLVFLFLAMLSITIHISAAFSKKTQLWNIRGGDVNIFPERIWDWKKPQFYPFD
ncbi:hypothetical protein [Leptospira bouyouniensis]|uniref:Glycosyltransferase RgtA/B/C/D-like domain-containing protein n=1 Tax=Leptospira bouyouniensis TaxID=2484911 RepID=A0ABY2L3S3_9LEPT|nr:hypothetical protein [Leptospira bouyouniensis]TGK48558.1 hypothetical protein EHQ10_12670 [Leptospira bouyouniensis]